MPRGKVIVLEQQLIKSQAWLELRGYAQAVYLLFRCKCQIQKRKGRPGKKDNLSKIVANNGELVFTYNEAKKKYGITYPRFSRAIGELIEKGFIDIAATGMGVHKVTTLYAISERWQDYGTPEFKKIGRPKRSIAIGFKKKSTNENVSGATNKNVNGERFATNENVSGEKDEISHKSKINKYLPCEVT